MNSYLDEPILDLSLFINRSCDSTGMLTTPFCLHSRCHVFPFLGEKVYLKRDDELSWGISGSKYRKFASLIPNLKKNKVKEIVIVGSPNANNISAGLQLFKEFGFNVKAYLKSSVGGKSPGNEVLTSLLLKPSEVVWVPRENWQNCLKNIENLKSYAEHEESFFLPEGGSHSNSLGGALSLALDIVKNEEQLGFSFSRVYIDAGTGFTARALVLGLRILGHSCDVRVIDIGGCSTTFFEELDRLAGVLRGYGFKIPGYQHGVKILRPSISKSFGSVSSEVIEFMKKIARESGVICDPIYSTKCIMRVREDLGSGPHASTLVIHSGGAMALFGFVSRLGL